MLAIGNVQLNGVVHSTKTGVVCPSRVPPTFNKTQHSFCVKAPGCELVRNGGSKLDTSHWTETKASMVAEDKDLFADVPLMQSEWVEDYDVESRSCKSEDLAR